ncbi:flagellar hook assembly protein FlgD [Amorphus sp. 3PC139-8]|uniref:flagellar hook assembly protein FlgD n=1 Tax=Amorphus sp. 3PC139-8 TaxID=2735676 RepID=UPI00345CFB61
MTGVSGLSSNATFAQDQTQAKSQSKTPDYDAFLMLLVTQLKNQDPTAPVEGTEYMSQLATFSQVEQAMQTNTKLDTLLTSSAMDIGTSMIGRQVTAADGSKSGEVASVRLTSDGPLATLTDGSTLMVGPGVTVS